jgi:hypothetical protein
MSIHSEYMSFKNHWTISSSYDCQAHLHHSRRTCSISAAPAVFQMHLQHSKRTGSISKEDVFPRLLYRDSRCSLPCCWLSLTCRRRFQSWHQGSQTCHQHYQVHLKFSLAYWGVHKLITITPMVLLNQSSEMSVTPKDSRNTLQQSDTLLQLTHLCLHSTSSLTLLEASRN